MKKNRCSKWLVSLILCFPFLFILPIKGVASNSGFYVTPVIPENQLENTVDYFNIGVPAAMNQTLEVVIVNESTEPKSVRLTLLDGMTTKDGTISYDKEHTYDDSQRYRLSKIAKLEQNEATVEPNSSATVKIQLKYDISDFYGTILGAVNVSEKEPDNTQVGVNNSFAYNIPIKIRVAEEGKENRLNYKGLTLNSEKTKQTLDLTFQNPEPTILRKLNLSFTVYKKDKPAESLWSSEMKEVELAPNSLFSPELSLTDSKLKAGKYVLKIVAKSDVIDSSWESDFTLSTSEKQGMNGGVEILSESNQWWLIISVAILVLGGAGYVFYKKKS
ncbi:DUF916 domain-containing protein [Enterococcus ureasiticus]|uniref:Uncharacterized protein n=1 Tax=Enterococcus ureasiticus TaxID=903984 RepID=A0A1E5GA32_9ENTE|nr:DUF916 domain-containing protein [Enterococcus ureasiticus]OEG09553.1 hypothetical protein BCR21_14485 [Enterococcus ureasiticus]